jgi:hypothetical protein
MKLPELIDGQETLISIRKSSTAQKVDRANIGHRAIDLNPKPQFHCWHSLVNLK